MLRINLTNSYHSAVAIAEIEYAREDQRAALDLYLAAGAAVERICQNPELGRSLGGVMFSHKLTGFPFSIIYEVTDVELCFLYLAAV